MSSVELNSLWRECLVRRICWGSFGTESWELEQSCIEGTGFRQTSLTHAESGSGSFLLFRMGLEGPGRGFSKDVPQ